MNLEPQISADVYANRIGRTLNSGFVSLMISIGHRTGLFDIMASLPPSTSMDIAVAAGLTERYVREWLAAMTAARIVHYDVRTGTYFLPIEYAAVLSRGAGSGNLAPAAQLLSMLASMEDMVVAGFHGGGGVAPEAYERLHALLADEKRLHVDEDYVEALLELMPGMDLRLAAGACVLDAGCGDGAVLTVLARMFPRSAFRGYDISQDAIDRANERADEAGLANVDFAVGDVASLDEPRSYDLVLALESIHEQAFPRLVLRNIANALKRDGLFLMQETAASSHLSRNVENPFAPMLYALSVLHAVPVALAQEGEALGRMWGEERARQMLREAGFTKTRFDGIASDPLRYYCVAAR
ncbi:MAG TPA: methyltransferase domain-containing protein [Thermoanaerobaculia bacterium]